MSKGERSMRFALLGLCLSLGLAPALVQAQPAPSGKGNFVNPEGRNVGTARLTQTPHGVLITVQDDGPGIAPEYQELIFRKFESLKAPNAPRVRSSGLGLTFCRLAVEAHGGRIWVQSQVGAGSAFHILLPLVPVPPERAAAAAAPTLAARPG